MDDMENLVFHRDGNLLGRNICKEDISCLNFKWKNDSANEFLYKNCQKNKCINNS